MMHKKWIKLIFDNIISLIILHYYLATEGLPADQRPIIT